MEDTCLKYRVALGPEDSDILQKTLSLPGVDQAAVAAGLRDLLVQQLTSPNWPEGQSLKEFLGYVVNVSPIAQAFTAACIYTSESCMEACTEACTESRTWRSLACSARSFGGLILLFTPASAFHPLFSYIPIHLIPL